MSADFKKVGEKMKYAKELQENMESCLCRKGWNTGEISGRVRAGLLFLGLIWIVSLSIYPMKSCAKSIPTSMSEATRDANYQKKYIRLKVISATGKKIKLKIINNGDKTFLYTEMDLKIKKKSQGKWKKIKFKKHVLFHKCLDRVDPNSSKTMTIKWKDYYNVNQFKKGKYQIIWMDSSK
ncbi:MAG: hypothetical protein K2K70_05550, partial [Lachnospiraceae bacterium]|nr:hypothetical protein [Lachnospiraceae bacterium]